MATRAGLTALCLCLAAAPRTAVCADGGWAAIADRFELLAEYHFSQDARLYSNHKDSVFHEAYLISALTEFEALVVSFDGAFHLGLLYGNYLGMGRQDGAVVLDPRDVNYTVTPFFEYRRGAAFFQAGLDHRCFHQIDRFVRETAYWNQAYVKASSANWRFKLMKENYIDKGRDGHADKLKWQVSAGYFVKEFGPMDPKLLSGGHPWTATAAAEAGYTFYRRGSWMFSGRSKIAMFSDTTGTPYWAGETGIDADVCNRRYAVGFFANCNYEFRRMPLPTKTPTPTYSDHGPAEMSPPSPFSKDRLFEWGIRFRL